MIAVMQKAANLDDIYYEQNVKRDQEYMSRLISENQGLRELLGISRKYQSPNPIDPKNCGKKISIETQTDNDLCTDVPSLTSGHSPMKINTVASSPNDGSKTSAITPSTS